MIAVAETMEEAIRNMELARQYPGILPAAGLYPEYADLTLVQEMQEFIRRQSGKMKLNAFHLERYFAELYPTKKCRSFRFRGHLGALERSRDPGEALILRYRNHPGQRGCLLSA